MAVAIYITVAIVGMALATWGDRLLRRRADDAALPTRTAYVLAGVAAAAGWSAFVLAASWYGLRWGGGNPVHEARFTEEPVPDWLWQAAIGLFVLAVLCGIAFLRGGAPILDDDRRLLWAMGVGFVVLNVAVPAIASAAASDSQHRYAPFLFTVITPLALGFGWWQGREWR